MEKREKQKSKMKKKNNIKSKVKWCSSRFAAFPPVPFWAVLHRVVLSFSSPVGVVLPLPSSITQKGKRRKYHHLKRREENHPILLYVTVL